MNNDAVSESQRFIVRHHAARSRRYLKAGAFLLLAMLAGFAIGVGTTVLYMKDKMHRVPPRPEAIQEAMVSRMHALFSVNPEEETRLREVMTSHMAQIETIRKDSFADIRDVFRRMDERFLEILGAERHDLWRKERERRFPKKHSGRSRDDGRSGPRHGNRSGTESEH